MTAVLPAPYLRTVDEPRFVPAPRVQIFPCPTCGVDTESPLGECVQQLCRTANNNHDRSLRHLEDQ